MTIILTMTHLSIYNQGDLWFDDSVFDQAEAVSSGRDRREMYVYVCYCVIHSVQCVLLS